MKNLENKNQLKNAIHRYQIETDKKNKIYVEEIHDSEMDSIWRTLSDIQVIF